MKYFGEPNLHIIDYSKSKEVFKIDSNGEYETEDENIIVNQFVRSIQKESKFVLDEIANRIYSLVKGEE